MSLLALLVCFLLAAPSGAPNPPPSRAGTGHGSALHGASQRAVAQRQSGHAESDRVRVVTSGVRLPPAWVAPLPWPSATPVVIPVTATSGYATWCAPTPTHCQSWGGDAMLGAVPSFRYGDDPYTVQVTAFEDGKANAVFVTVVSYCACGSRHGIPTVIDLSPAAFRSLAPLSQGVIRVTVDGVPNAPATDL